MQPAGLDRLGLVEWTPGKRRTVAEWLPAVAGSGSGSGSGSEFGNLLGR